MGLVFGEAGPKNANNERLEHIGDSVLGLAVTSDLSYRNPWLQEGDLTRIRAYAVGKTMLYRIAKNAGVVGNQHQRSGGTKTVSDLVEAAVGAVFVDRGFWVAAFAVLNLYANRLCSSDLLAFADPRVLTEVCLGCPDSSKQQVKQFRKYRGFCLVKWWLGVPRYCCLGCVGYGKQNKGAGRKATRKLLRQVLLG